MLTFLLLDFEATEKDPKLARPIEIATHHIREDLSEVSPLQSDVIYGLDYPTVSKEIEELTGISNDEVVSSGKAFVVAAYDRIRDANPDFIVAHNKGYDRTVFDMECDRNSLPRLEIPWICTLRDHQWPERQNCKKLSHLTLDHGVTVDPKTLHRAAGDVRILLQLIQAAKLDLKYLASRAMIPEITIRALVPKPWDDGGKGKDKAKACGFGWETAPGTDGPKFAQSWVKRIKEDKLIEEKERLGYGIKQL